MRNLKVYQSWQQQPMHYRNDTSVNPIPADYIDSVVIGKGPYAGCMDLVIKSTPELGGALASPQTDAAWPTGFVPLYFGFNRKCMSLTPDQEGRDEFDVKWTFSGGLQLNGSNQINWGSSGMWQVDPSGGAWINSGFTTKRVSGWNEFQVRWSTDGSTIWNIDTLYANGVTFTNLPSSCKSIPLIQTNWSSGGHMQLQQEVMNCPAYDIVRYLDAQLIFSDQVIPIGWY